MAINGCPAKTTQVFDNFKTEGYILIRDVLIALHGVNITVAEGERPRIPIGCHGYAAHTRD